MNTTKSIRDNNDHWLVNDRYKIYKANGVTYDTLRAEDIPQSIFGIRDRMMECNRIVKARS